MNYSGIKNFDIANGPGIRVSVFVSGCRNHCKGCFNPETWSFTYGQEFTTKTVQGLLEALKDPNIDGLSVLGGDPFEPENRYAVAYKCRLAKLRCPTKSVWVWTGYLWEDLRDLEMMKYIDVLVDGRFEESLKDLRLAYCGSSNQRVIDVKKSLASGEVVLWDA